MLFLIRLNKIKNYLIISILSVFLTNTICIPSSLVDTGFEIKNKTTSRISLSLDYKHFDPTSGYLDSGKSFGFNSTGKNFTTASSVFNSVIIKDSGGTELLNLSGDALDTHFKLVERNETFNTISYRLDVN